ncbi:MAG: GDSL-type esterase/lipase family protein [Faecalibacterium sp.]
MEHLTRVPLSVLPHVRVLGRSAGRDPLTLFWTASGIELIFTGSELWVDFFADYELVEPWVSVELNGAWLARFAVNPGTSRVCLFRGMTPGTPKHVRLLKDVQAMFDDPRHCLQITGLAYREGEFLPLPAPAYRLEFVGDSITSGEGTLGAVQEEDWVGAFFSAENHYARMTADALGAEYRCISQSGWGVVSGWDNDPRHILPLYYPQVCGVAQGERNAALGAQQPNDFAAWQPDAVIINLGTNDNGAFDNPAWIDPQSGQRFEQRLLPDGTFRPADAQRLADSVTEFLALVRQKNPDALLVWCIGMLGSRILPVLQQGVEQYKAATGDARACLLRLPETTPETVGARQHPGVENHRAAARVLTAFLKQAL